MPTALTGSLGTPAAQPGLVQLGGPAYAQSYARSIAALTTPLIAHGYANDGVTYTGPLGPVMNRPVLRATTANGGFSPITIELAIKPASLIWGQFVWGTKTWGGVAVTHGSVIRLSEQGGDGSFVYSGIVEEFPETVSPTKTTHGIMLSPLAYELDDTYIQTYYAAPVDVAQIVRDAVVATAHCSYDPSTIPVSTGVMAATTGAVDFRNQTAKQAIETARSIAGPTWYWFVDELGRVWFQPMGSGAVYTLMMGPHYEERISNGGSIQSRKNQVVGVGGVPTGGSANIKATYNGSSQSSIGVRALDPPISIPNITDQAALQSIVNTVGAVTDRVFSRVKLKVHRPFGQRIHGSQPGGAMIRYWEPVASSLQESGVGSGGYSGPYIAQSVENQGTYQVVDAGDIPVTSHQDIDNMVRSLVSRAAANSLQVTAAALNQVQTLTGTWQSGGGTVPSPGGLGPPLPAALWALNQQIFAAYDPNGVRRVEMGNLQVNGISPAQWGFRANDASGNPIFDSLGLIGVMQSLGTATNIGNGQSTSSTTVVDLTGGSVTFSLSRSAYVLAYCSSFGTVSSGTGQGRVTFAIDGTPDMTNGTSSFWQGSAFNSPTNHWSGQLSAGSHTLKVQARVIGASTTFFYSFGDIQVWLLGS